MRFLTEKCDSLPFCFSHTILLPGEGKRCAKNRRELCTKCVPPGKQRQTVCEEKNYFIKNILLYIIPRTNSSSNRILYLLPQEENRTYNSPSSSTISVMVTQW